MTPPPLNLEGLADLPPHEPRFQRGKYIGDKVEDVIHDDPNYIRYLLNQTSWRMPESLKELWHQQVQWLNSCADHENGPDEYDYRYDLCSWSDLDPNC